MSKEIEPAAIEGTIVEPVIPIHFWGLCASDITDGLVNGAFRDPESGNVIFEPIRMPNENT